MTFVEAVTSRWRAALVGAVVLPGVLSLLPVWYVEVVSFGGYRNGVGGFTSVWSAAADFRSWVQVEMFLTDVWNNVLFVASIWVGAALGVGFSHWWTFVTDPKPEPAMASTPSPPPPPVPFWIASLMLVLLGGCCLLARGADDEFAKEYAWADGTWVVTAMEMDGDDVPAAGFKGRDGASSSNGTGTPANAAGPRTTSDTFAASVAAATGTPPFVPTTNASFMPLPARSSAKGRPPLGRWGRGGRSGRTRSHVWSLSSRSRRRSGLANLRVAGIPARDGGCVKTRLRNRFYQQILTKSVVQGRVEGSRESSRSCSA